MRIICHREHRYRHAATDVVHIYTPHSVYDLEEELARTLVSSHPSKMCLLGDGQDASKHKCDVQKQVKLEERQAQEARATTVIEEAPVEKRMSPQKRRTRRSALHRSIIARRNTLG